MAIDTLMSLPKGAPNKSAEEVGMEEAPGRTENKGPAGSRESPIISDFLGFRNNPMDSACLREVMSSKREELGPPRVTSSK